MVEKFCDRFFLSDKDIVLLESSKEGYILFVWKLKRKDENILYHIEEYDRKDVVMEVRSTRMDVMQNILKNYEEYDPELLDHNDPKSLFSLDIGGEGGQ